MSTVREQDSADLEATMDRIAAHLTALGRSAAARWRPGADPAVVTAGLVSLGLQAPPELLRLYAICDGLEVEEGDLLGDLWLFPGYYCSSLDEAMERHQSWIHFGREMRNPAWFPFMQNGGGDNYAVICDATSPDYGCVVQFLIHDAGQVVVRFKSIGTMLKIIERCYAESAFFLAGGWLEVDDEKMKVIEKALQPGFTEHDARTS